MAQQYQYTACDCSLDQVRCAACGRNRAGKHYVRFRNDQLSEPSKLMCGECAELEKLSGEPVE